MPEQDLLWSFRWGMCASSATLLAFDVQFAVSRSGDFILFLLGGFVAGFLMGLTTVRKRRDLLFAMLPALAYPAIAFFVRKPGGDAGVAAGLGLIILPLFLFPVQLIGALTGWGLSNMNRP